MAQAGSWKSWVRLGHHRISQVPPGFLRGVRGKRTWAKLPAQLWKVAQGGIWGEGKGVLGNVRRWKQNKTEITLREYRPIATLEPSGADRIRVLKYKDSYSRHQIHLYHRADHS